MRRHEALRTTFALVDGEPVQVIDAPHGRSASPLTDLDRLPEREREAEVQRLAREEARRPSTSRAARCSRAALLRLGRRTSTCCS